MAGEATVGTKKVSDGERWQSSGYERVADCLDKAENRSIEESAQDLLVSIKSQWQ